jgi:hypothetical protein
MILFNCPILETKKKRHRMLFFAKKFGGKNLAGKVWWEKFWREKFGGKSYGGKSFGGNSFGGKPIFISFYFILGPNDWVTVTPVQVPML